MEREETEASSERAERLANLLTLSYEPMLAWRLDGSIEFWNAGAERLYGFALDEAIGRSSHSLLQTKFPIEFTELRSQLRNERYWSGELRHICKDVRSRWALGGAQDSRKAPRLAGTCAIGIPLHKVCAPPRMRSVPG